MDLTPGHLFTSTGGTIEGAEVPWFGSNQPFVVTLIERGGKDYLHGTVGCNVIAPEVSWGPSTINPVGDGLWMAQMGCRAPLPAHEEFAVEFLQSPLTYRYDGTKLTLTSGPTSVEFVRSDSELLGNSYESTSGLPADLRATAPLTLAFTGDDASSMRVQAHISCSVRSLAVVVRGDSLVVRPEGVDFTLKPCGDERDRQDAWAQAFLESSPTIGVDGDVLTLTTAGDSVAFRRTA